MELIKEEKVNSKQEQPKNSNNKKQKDLRYEIIDSIKTIGVTVVITLLIIHFAVQLSVVRGESMANTFHDSNIVLLEKFTQRFSNLDRFDVIVFNTDNPEKPYYIKRIIGLPGETVKIDDYGNIFINGELLEEHYGREVIEDAGLAATEITVGEDEFFVLGDNRNNSIDSRFEQVGLVKKDEVLGHVALGLSPLINPNEQQSL